MAGVFLSYSRADRETAVQLTRGLRGLGVDVWWDEDMAGVDWQAELEHQITELTGVVVLWTPSSRDSPNVRDEARLALGREKLINVIVGLPQPPFPFDRVTLPAEGAPNGQAAGAPGQARPAAGAPAKPATPAAKPAAPAAGAPARTRR